MDGDIMAAITSIYKDPSKKFVWWIEGDRLAIATIEGDANTTETGEGKLKAIQLSVSSSLQTDGSTKNLVAESVDATQTTIDVDDGSVFSQYEIIQINDEIIRIESISTNTLTVTRGFRNTTATTHATDLSSLTTLGAAISDTNTTSVTLSSVSSLSVDDIIKVDSEVLRVTAIDTDTNIITVIRGRHGSTAATHSNGASVSKFDNNGLIKEHDEILRGLTISYYAEPDKLTSITGTIDIDNVLQPALIDYVKSKALMECMANYKEAVRRYGMKKNDKVGGTRAIAPVDMR
jgi:hypothetical protein